MRCCTGCGGFAGTMARGNGGLVVQGCRDVARARARRAVPAGANLLTAAAAATDARPPYCARVGRCQVPTSLLLHPPPPPPLRCSRVSDIRQAPRHTAACPTRPRRCSDVIALETQRRRTASAHLSFTHVPIVTSIPAITPAAVHRPTTLFAKLSVRRATFIAASIARKTALTAPCWTCSAYLRPLLDEQSHTLA